MRISDWSSDVCSSDLSTAASPILELALLDVRSGQTGAFRRALAEALPLIRRQPGCLGAEVRPCLEDAQRFVLLVTWARLADHDPGFRQSGDRKSTRLNSSP